MNKSYVKDSKIICKPPTLFENSTVLKNYMIIPNKIIIIKNIIIKV